MQRGDIEAFKRDHPVEVVVASYDILLRPSGQALVGRCPFHDDRGRPNFFVYPATQSWCCYRCGAGGDVIRFVERMERVGFAEAIDRLTNGIRLREVELLRLVQPSKVQPLGKAERAALEVAVMCYHTRLLADPAALAYLQERGLSLATITRYRLGYACGADLVPQLRQQGVTLAAAQRVGLLRSGREFLAGRIVVPEIRAGQPVWLIGRAFRCLVESAKYLGLPSRKPLLGWEEASRSQVVYLVEGPFDWLTLRQWGLPALCLSGVHARPDALKALRQFERVYLALDNDETGRQATDALVSALGRRALVIRLQGVKDVADLAPLPDGRDRFLNMAQETVSSAASIGRARGQGGAFMSRSVNRVELVGRLGRDPEMRYTPEGHVVTKFSVATDRPARQDSETVTDWHQVVCWGQLAEFSGQYLGKGRLVFVAGRITYRSWEGKDGQKRYATEIVASEVIALDRRPDPSTPEPAAEEPVF